jgi:hypothetical protein
MACGRPPPLRGLGGVARKGHPGGPGIYLWPCVFAFLQYIGVRHRGPPTRPPELVIIDARTRSPRVSSEQAMPSGNLQMLTAMSEISGELIRVTQSTT